MSTHRLLQTLEQQISTLVSQIPSQADVAVSQARFDVGLFSNQGTRLCDYLTEVKKNFVQLQMAVAQERAAHVAFLAERLVLQLTALQREVATLSLRKNNQPNEPIAVDLYHKLAEHQDYERRLLSMLKDRETLLSRQTTFNEQKKLQHELAAIEGRLLRCRQALARIERSIEKKENSF